MVTGCSIMPQSIDRTGGSSTTLPTLSLLTILGMSIPPTKQLRCPTSTSQKMTLRVAPTMMAYSFTSETSNPSTLPSKWWLTIPISKHATSGSPPFQMRRSLPIRQWTALLTQPIPLSQPTAQLKRMQRTLQTTQATLALLWYRGLSWRISPR